MHTSTYIRTYTFTYLSIIIMTLVLYWRGVIVGGVAKANVPGLARHLQESFGGCSGLLLRNLV